MSNFLNDEQVEKLYAKKWNVKSDGAYINLYREDFENESKIGRASCRERVSSPV